MADTTHAGDEGRADEARAEVASGECDLRISAAVQDDSPQGRRRACVWIRPRWARAGGEQVRVCRTRDARRGTHRNVLDSRAREDLVSDQSPGPALTPAIACDLRIRPRAFTVDSAGRAPAVLVLVLTSRAYRQSAHQHPPFDAVQALTRSLNG